jgi:hypothetical protein
MDQHHIRRAPGGLAHLDRVDPAARNLKKLSFGGMALPGAALAAVVLQGRQANPCPQS